MRNVKSYRTVSCHLTGCTDFEKNDSDTYISDLLNLAKGNKAKVVAIGECGLGELKGNGMRNVKSYRTVSCHPTGCTEFEKNDV